MKHEVCVLGEDREFIRRARRDAREARGNEEREKREDEIGSHCFLKSSGYDKLELKHQNLVFFKLIECIIKKKIRHGVKRMQKYVPLVRM